MVSSVAELVAGATADRRTQAVLALGDWYLVGSRAAGFADDLSDWGTVLLTPTDVAGENVPGDVCDAVFGVERPAVEGPPTLDQHERSRVDALWTSR